MRPLPFAALRGPAFALATFALLALGTSCSREAPTSARVVPNPPTPSTPTGVVDLFQWCWNNRDLWYYAEVFTDDFRFTFTAADTIGNPYAHSFTRDDMLISTDHLFAGGGTVAPAANSIRLMFNGGSTPSRSTRTGSAPPLIEAVQVPDLTLSITQHDGSTWTIAGGALFWVVRGDNAIIPQELFERGIRPDSTRWFISGMVDGTGPSPGGSMPNTPTIPSTWGRLLLLYQP